MKPRHAAWPLLAALGATSAAAAPAAGPACQRLLQALQPGDVLRPADLQPAACTPELQRLALRHDTLHHVTRARVALAAGDIVPAVNPGALARWRAGDAVRVTQRAGPVQVQRAARLAAPVASGSAGVLVRTDDGAAIRAQPSQIEVLP